MSDPQSLGLGELSQRVQAMSAPVSDQRPELRPDSRPDPRPDARNELKPDHRYRSYQGAPLPIGPASNGRPTPGSYGDSEHGNYGSQQTYEDVRVAPPPPTPFPGPSLAPPSSASHTYAAPYPGLPASGLPGPTPVLANAQEAQNVESFHGAESAAPSQLPGVPSATTSAAHEDPNAPKSSIQRIVGVLRAALPIMQKLLPLLDGNFANTLGALMVQNPAPPHPPASPTEVRVDLEPVERGLAELRSSQRELRGQVQEQTVGLKRVEDQLERVREATDRNTLEQQELVEDLRAVGNRISTLVWSGVALLILLLGANIFFLIQLQHVLR